MSNKEGQPSGINPEWKQNREQDIALEKYLLVPRKPRGFKEVDGWIEPINLDLDMPITPVVIVGIPDAGLVGFRSGRRSGLLSVENVEGKKAIKIKGCRVLSATKIEGPYKVARTFLNGNNGGSPEGGQILSAVQREIENTLVFNELLTTEVFPVPYEPEAIIHYGKMFKPDDRSEYSEELAASVMQVRGDTRLAELYRLKTIDTKEARRIAHRLGLMAGAQKKITNGFYWKDSENVGNYVVFLEGNQLHLGPVDLEDTVPYENVDIPEEKQYLSTMPHYPAWVSGLSKRDLSGAPDLEMLVIAKTFGSMYRSSLSFVEGIRTEPTSRARYAAPVYFSDEFKRGFRDGYKNPNKREPITCADLNAAFGLKVSGPIALDGVTTSLPECSERGT